MAPIKHEHGIAVAHRLYAIDVVYNCLLCRLFGAYSGRKVHRHYPARTVLVIVVEELVQYASLCFIYIAQGTNLIHDSVHRRLDFLVQIVVKVQEVNLLGAFNAIRRRGLVLKEFLH